MKLMTQSALLVLGLCSITSINASELEKPTLIGDYLGQPPPGMTPEVFAPGIISTSGWEYGVVFAPNMAEMYYVREAIVDNEPQQQFVVFEKKQDQWHERVISKRVGTPTLSPDNDIMFFGRGYKTRTDEGWSEMKRLGADFNEIRIMRVTASLNGTIAFDEAVADGNSKLRYSTFENGRYTPPKLFPKTINTGAWNAHPFIAPDESYLIWDGRGSDEEGKPDLYISFKQQDGSWGDAIKMGDTINTSASEFAAQITPDGKYLFFNRTSEDGNTDTYWVDAKVIETFRP
ncbi:TolB family protein [Alteromonas facilis]|uniref:TolB family protein n=1 Tax=Alteromonas facilis TaxID=2048004 RepID=UPI000C28F5AF|nr:PD40 domain-containing protein [Alteromonas facilis]